MTTDLQALKVRMLHHHLIGAESELADNIIQRFVELIFDSGGGSCGAGCEPGCASGCQCCCGPCCMQGNQNGG